MEGIISNFSKRSIDKRDGTLTYSYFFLDSKKHFTFFNLWIPENLKNVKSYEKNRIYNLLNYDSLVKTNNFFHYLENPENIDKFLNLNVEKIYSNLQAVYSRYKHLDSRVFDIFGKTRNTYGLFVGNGAFYIEKLDSISFKAVLCIKQEYVRYFKLWLLTKQTIEDLLEFDIFYILVDKSFEIELNTKKQLKTVFNKTFGNLVKHYGIPVTFVDNLTKELLKTVSVPKFNTIKEYNNWLDEIKINTFKKEIINE